MAGERRGVSGRSWRVVFRETQVSRGLVHAEANGLRNSEKAVPGRGDHDADDLRDSVMGAERVREQTLHLSVASIWVIHGESPCST